MSWPNMTDDERADYEKPPLDVQRFACNMAEALNDPETTDALGYITELAIECGLIADVADYQDINEDPVYHPCVRPQVDKKTD
ncbi:MAG: hypothetical protein MJH10_09710 [Epibacterium sp.]|nr:hypothetical protein [Epibacterium sp.]NQX73811.1 hypothetical protein [Epibacterium sp.]